MQRHMPAGRIDFYNETRIKIHRGFTRFDGRVRDRKNFTACMPRYLVKKMRVGWDCDNKVLFLPGLFGLFVVCDGAFEQ